MSPAQPVRNVPMEMDKNEKEQVLARYNRDVAFQAWKLLEAKLRLKLRAVDESTGKRRASADVEAEITVARGDPEHEIGVAWLISRDLKRDVDKLEADHLSLERIKWQEINRGKYGT